MPFATSLTQVQIYAVDLVKELTKRFPNKKFKLKRLTGMGSNPEHFIVTKKENLFRTKSIEGISTSNSSVLSIWEKDDEIKEFIILIVNKKNKHSITKFKIELKR